MHCATGQPGQGLQPERLLLPQRPEEARVAARRPADIYLPSFQGLEAGQMALAAAASYTNTKERHLDTAAQGGAVQAIGGRGYWGLDSRCFYSPTGRFQSRSGPNEPGNIAPARATSAAASSFRDLMLAAFGRIQRRGEGAWTGIAMSSPRVSGSYR